MTGRGIPVGMHSTGISALEVVFTKLHAGGKFGGEGYKVSGGLHGVGASVVNALSEWLEVEVCDGSQVHFMRFERGDVIEPIKVIGKTDKTGSKITFKPDPEIFEETEFDFELLKNRLREQAFLNAGIKIYLEDLRGEHIECTLHYEGGIRSFVEHINKNKTPIHPEVIYLTGCKDDNSAEIAMQYNDGYNENILSFANNIHTTEGGMHETGFKTALTRSYKRLRQKYGILKQDEKITGEGLRKALSA